MKITDKDRNEYFDCCNIPVEYRERFLQRLDDNDHGFQCFLLGREIQNLKITCLNEFDKAIDFLKFWRK